MAPAPSSRPGAAALGAMSLMAYPAVIGRHRYTDHTANGTLKENEMTLALFVKEYLTALVATRIVKSERGASLVEYALLVALIAVVCIVAIGFIGTEANTKFEQVGSSLN